MSTYCKTNPKRDILTLYSMSTLDLIMRQNVHATIHPPYKYSNKNSSEVHLLYSILENNNYDKIIQISMLHTVLD
jgi:hypothetical protein